MVAIEDATEAVSQADSESEDQGDSRLGEGNELSTRGYGGGGVVSVSGAVSATAGAGSSSTTSASTSSSVNETEDFFLSWPGVELWEERIEWEEPRLVNEGRLLDERDSSLLGLCIVVDRDGSSVCSSEPVDPPCRSRFRPRSRTVSCRHSLSSWMISFDAAEEGRSLGEARCLSTDSQSQSGGTTRVDRLLVATALLPRLTAAASRSGQAVLFTNCLS